MEKKTMGSFMATLRKANGLTQQQVADRLNVSNKTVSKWECDDGYPEITLLPVIAELYSVTTDELLRGERIVKEDINDSVLSEKSEKRAVYLFNSATEKFTTLSIICAIIAAMGLIVNVFGYSYAYIFVLVVLAIGAAIIIQVIAYTKYKPVPDSSCEFVAESLIISAKRKILRFVLINTALSVFTLLSLIISQFLIVEYVIVLIISAFITLIVCCFVYALLEKTLDISKSESKDYLEYRQKLLKRILILTLVTAIVVFSVPFINVYIDSKMLTSYDLRTAYATAENAEREYMKLKDLVLNGKKLYWLYGTGDKSADVGEIIIDTQKENDKIKLLSIDFDSDFNMQFETDEQMHDFVQKSTVNGSDYAFLENATDCFRYITFDDENLTLVTEESSVRWYLVADVIIIYALIMMALATLYLALGVFLCTRKRKALEGNLK